jgi:hypothetical protein
LVPALFTAWSLVLLTRAHAIFLRPAIPLNQDEGYIAAIGQRMLDGQLLPYVDGVSHRGPMLYWVASVLELFGRESWVPVRLGALATFFVPALFTFLAGRRAGMPVAGAFGAAATPFACLALLPDVKDGIALNGESLLNMFAVLALYALVRALARPDQRPRTAWIAAAGALAMLGGLSKQVGLVAIGPLLLWVVAAAASRPMLSRRERWRLVLAFAGGAAAPLGLVVLRYAVSGELRTFWYYLVQYNFDVYMAPFRGTSRLALLRTWFLEHLTLLTISLVALAWGAAQALLDVRLERRALAAAYDRRGFLITVALSAVFAMLGVKAAMRDWGHYFVQAVPWCGLLGGLLIEPAMRSLAGARRGALAAAQALILFPVLVVTEAVWTPRARVHTRNLRHFSSPPVCRTIHAHSTPDDSLFVWGFWAELYTFCARRPASRYVFTTFPAGLVPWFIHASKQEDDARAVPGSREILIAELEAEKPPVIVDGHARFAHRPMRRYEQLGAYLDQHYAWIDTVQGAEVLLRGKKNRRMLFDFEGERLGLDGWERHGDAFFDESPPVGRPGQSPVFGQQGSGFVNSFTTMRRDAATGTAVSPWFVIDRSHLGLLYAGGRTASVGVRIEGGPTLSKTGSDTEQFFEAVWDVAMYRGKRARVALEDPSTAPWGHIMVDRIELFDI